MAVRAHLFKVDGRVLGGMQFGVLVQVLFWRMTVRAYFLHLDGGMQGGMQFGVVVLMVLQDAVCGELLEVLVTVRAHFTILTLGCYRACR